MNYFDNFNKIPYAFLGSDGNQFLLNLVDITANVRVRKQLSASLQSYEYYDIIDGEPIDKVSQRLYGTPFFHWLLMLLNDKYDYVEDFPKTSDELFAYVTEKYGAGNEYSAHTVNGQPHYVDRNGNTISVYTSGEFLILHPGLSQQDLDQQYSAYLSAYQGVTNMDYEDDMNESKRRIKILTKSSMISLSNQLGNLLIPS